MDERSVRETIEQIHISEEMQEEIIMNIQARMKTGKYRIVDWKKMAAVVATFILTVGIVSIPVQAIVKSVVKERMENIPTEEVQNINDMVQGQAVLADGFSREYSDSEKERNKALWQAYENGTFPENVIAQVDNAEDASEGNLCYIRSTGVFQLPAQEMTDEEILEIIDFQHKMSYSVTQRPVSQDAGTEMVVEENQLREKVQAAGGISEEKAIEIARKQMESDLGARAKEKELITDVFEGHDTDLEDISDYTEYNDKADIAYFVYFGSLDKDNYTCYTCVINAVDGSILDVYEVGLD